MTPKQLAEEFRRDGYECLGMAYAYGDAGRRAEQEIDPVVPDPNWFGEFWALNHRWPTDQEVQVSNSRPKEER